MNNNTRHETISDDLYFITEELLSRLEKQIRIHNVQLASRLFDVQKKYQDKNPVVAEIEKDLYRILNALDELSYTFTTNSKKVARKIFLNEEVNSCDLTISGSY